ncbi:RICIN domain-containing protein [Paenibacillus sp. OK003]|uniref:RICIN domain-containing protein n=1 Tax=Paenibacillus sp. OK003 TaxID=1884380 RepID=UPI0008ABF7B8|nr:RICIN domain-containing protein [Paenibacillus sp. OK003]SEL81740.1 Ricin-type beta-trefoil lectin domain-like [Paenibacillus sp. OK003]
MLRKTSTIMLIFYAILLVVSASASAYGPSIMYDPATNPNSISVGAMYPRAIQLAHNGANNGKMYATFQRNTSTQQVYPIYESTDNGENWAQVGEVQDTQNGLGMNTNPHLYEMPQTIGSLTAGTMLVAGISSPADNSVQYLDLYKSTDLGRSWTFVSNITEAPNAGIGEHGDPVWEPFLMVANDKLIVYYSDERDPAYSQKLVHQTTTDGTTWSSPVDDSAMTDSKLRPGMPVVTKLQDGSGRYIMTYEVVGISGTPCNYKISSNPESWNVTDYGTTFATGGSPYVVTLNDGRIAAGCYSGGGVMYINSKPDLTGSWITTSTPIAGGYSRQMVPLANGRLFFTSSQGFWESGTHPVYYADMAVPGTSTAAKRIQNRATSLSVDGWGSFNAGADTKQNASNNSYNEQWTFIPYGNNYLIQNNGTALYLDGYGRTTDGSKVAQHTLSHHPNQQWILENAGSYYKIKNAATGLYLDGLDSTTNGANLGQSLGNDSSSQQWTLVTP